ncbi:MAG: EAL domain-containing protein [Proteobacteria bacterium]|nr:EAL domain-containing protein [Pseudomonadota bacterium]
MSTVPLIVLSASREPVEIINSVLRQAGRPSHCTWISSLRDLADGIAQLNPEAVLHVTDDPQELQLALRARARLAATVPVLQIVSQVDETRIAIAMAQGARDAVTLENTARLQAVLLRELSAFHTARLLESAQKAAQDARNQLETVLRRSNDAIVLVQEGIVTEANPAWLELFGMEDGIAGQPVMDLFDESSHAALRGALAACLQDRWEDHPLRLKGLLSDGSVLSIEATLALGQFEGEPCVRLVAPVTSRSTGLSAAPAAQTGAAAASPAASAAAELHGQLLQRGPLLAALAARLATPSAGGMRALALIRIDKFAALERVVGVTASEQVLADVSRLVRESLYPREIAGRFGGVRLLALLERGNEQDVNAWAERLLASVSQHVMRVRDKSVCATCTIGISIVSPGDARLDAVIADALECARRGATRGGNQSVTSDRADHDSRVMSYDRVWVKHIKAALMENRFRLVQQPIASLQGEDPGMFDVLVRMVDANGKEVLPSEFMAAAGRNDLMKNIDRWVAGASLSFAAQKKPACLFVRLSKDSLRDSAFIDWLDLQLHGNRAEAQRLCFQLSEESAASYLPQTRSLTAALRERGVRCALASFGAGRDSAGLLETLPLDFIKIDGTLIQQLAGDREVQQRVRLLVEAARKRGIHTIAERVEDANTMAVLWQIGVQYIQGYFVNEPEEVVLHAER